MQEKIDFIKALLMCHMETCTVQGCACDSQKLRKNLLKSYLEKGNTNDSVIIGASDSLIKTQMQLSNTMKHFQQMKLKLIEVLIDAYKKD